MDRLPPCRLCEPSNWGQLSPSVVSYNRRYAVAFLPSQCVLALILLRCILRLR